ncbi:hypothetical protein BB560_003861 [Smittium megazygosporum]|uniref:Phosphoribosylaminoimidazole-succinocarboxamide synthase n=1 Tax=Smittium megazygosporum TaxID=133381 RepID=A0A2T9ZAR5_9FUNG|nr:hypothetical protein BB560_003861 [Smittium megazygosporum]
MTTWVESVDLSDLELFSRGKVRDIYSIDSDKLLFVASDRISAYDVIMKTPIQGKGKILTQFTIFWLNLFKDIVPNHLITHEISEMPPAVQKHADILEHRCMLVKKLNVLPFEAIVRGYITGSGWEEYAATGSICGISLPQNLKQSQKLSEPIFTPSTKAELGDHVVDKLGEELANQMKQTAIDLYKTASEYALSRGIIIADTKFEFGVDSDGKLYLIDEVLTPDSSRFWPLSGYKLGISQNSFDKQYLRDYLSSIDFDKQTPVDLPPTVVDNTFKKYIEAFVKITGSRPTLF